MNIDAIIALITAVIGAGASITVAQLSIKKTFQQKEVEMARLHQSYEDRFKALENQQAQADEQSKKLNNIENTVIEIKKDIEYLRKGQNI